MDIRELVIATPKRYQILYVKALVGDASPMQAIKAKCYECVGFEDVAERVRDCTVLNCSLWRYRPCKE